MPFFAAIERHPALSLVMLCLALYVPGFFTLPVLDRDEARFAQATVQMHETGDYMVPRFQDDLRAKKPVAIYWAQTLTTGAVRLAGADGPGGHPDIWAFRIPSLIGAIVVVLLTWRLGVWLYDARTGFIAGGLMAATVLLIAEANIAKTDAALAAAIMAAQLALARVWLARDGTRPAPGTGNTVLFWTALAIGILLKGPVAPMVCGLTLVALAATSRQVRWIGLLRPVRGGILMVLLTLPWAVSVWISTDGTFFGDAVGGDLLPKLVGGQEGHGAPFGYYLALLAVAFFPANLLLLPALAKAWGARRTDAVIFLAAWIIPSWLVFEIVPTKLPHYVLPLYPALAILTAAFIAACLDAPTLLKARAARLNMVLWAVIAAVLSVAIIALPLFLPDGTAVEPGPWPVVGAGVFAAMAIQTLAMAWRARPAAMVVALAATGIALSVALLELTRPAVHPLWVAVRAADILDARGLAGAAVASAGFSEPSVVFMLGTDTRLTNGAKAAQLLAEGAVGVALVERRQADAFAAAAARLGLRLAHVADVDGLNYSRGDAVSIAIYTRAAPLT